MKLLALDFDGVISDSATESFAVALRTYAVLRPGGAMARQACALHGAAAAELRDAPVYRAFVELMPLGNRAEDFGVVLGLLEAGGWADDQGAYDAVRDGAPAGFLESFHACFYRERAELRAADRDAWVALLAPFEPIVEMLQRRAGDVTLCIATAKDRASVDVLLDQYGLRDLFPPDRVIDKENGPTKRAHLTTLRDRLGVAFGDITFVDDKFNHLLDVSNLGVRCALAAWGYNGEREQQLAHDAGHLVCALGDVDAQLFT